MNVSGLTTLNNTTTINSSLNVSGTTTLNNTTTINSSLDVVNKTTTQDLQVKGILTLPVNNWIIDNNSNVTNNQRIFFDSGAKTYFKSGGTSTSPLLDGFIFRNGQAGTDLLNIDGSGNSTQLGTLLVKGITCMSTLNVSGLTTLNNATTCTSSLNVSGTTTFLNNVTLKGQLINQYWKFTNDSDYCRLNGVGGGYFNFAAQDLYSSGIVNANGIIYANGDKLNFPNLLNQYKN